MERLEAKNIPYKIADMIGEMIIKMELLPGERLYEGKLSKELAVSQGVIREAFRILEKSGLVTISQRKGTSVTLLDERYIETLFDILAELYVLLVKKAIPHYDDGDKKALLAVIDKIETCTRESDTDGYYEGIFEFADIVLKVSNDALLENLILELWPNKRRIEYETILLRRNHLAGTTAYYSKIRKQLVSNRLESVSEILRELVYNEKKIALELMKKKRGSA